MSSVTNGIRKAKVTTKHSPSTSHGHRELSRWRTEEESESGSSGKSCSARAQPQKEKGRSIAMRKGTERGISEMKQAASAGRRSKALAEMTTQANATPVNWSSAIKRTSCGVGFREPQHSMGS